MSSFLAFIILKCFKIEIIDGNSQSNSTRRCVNFDVALYYCGRCAQGSVTIESSDTESESEETKPKPKNKASGPFKPEVRKKMEALLRTLTATRADVGRAMAHALENAEWSDEVGAVSSSARCACETCFQQISDMIVMSIMLPTTPNPRKIARLYLTSDILANSSNTLPSAWKYRSAFEDKLLPVFEHLNQVYQSFPGRMKADAFKRQITNVLAHWEALLIFTPSVLEEYNKRLLSGGAPEEDLEGAPIQDSEMIEEAKPVKAGFRNIKASRAEDLDGAPMDEDLDGEAM